MQYLLTQDEIDGLTQKTEVTERDHALAAAREKILVLAGFDCIHDKDGRNGGGYCDSCPCSRAANGWDRACDRVCWLRQRYSK